MFNKDVVTSVIGAIGAIALSVGPVLEGVATPSLHSANWMQLLFAVMFGLQGYFTNKK